MILPVFQLLSYILPFSLHGYLFMTLISLHVTVTWLLSIKKKRSQDQESSGNSRNHVEVKGIKGITDFEMTFLPFGMFSLLNFANYML